MLNIKVFKNIVILSLSLCIAASSLAKGSECNQRLVDETRNFALHLLDRNEHVLVKKYASSAPSFTTDGKLNQDIHDFLYNQHASEGWSSVQDIVTPEDMAIKLISQKGNVVTALFFKEQYEEDANDIEFLRNEWMKKYFACEFEVVGDNLFFYQNICFAETDGPFPPEYDI